MLHHVDQQTKTMVSRAGCSSYTLFHWLGLPDLLLGFTGSHECLHQPPPRSSLRPRPLDSFGQKESKLLSAKDQEVTPHLLRAILLIQEGQMAKTQKKPNSRLAQPGFGFLLSPLLSFQPQCPLTSVKWE